MALKRVESAFITVERVATERTGNNGPARARGKTGSCEQLENQDRHEDAQDEWPMAKELVVTWWPILTQVLSTSTYKWFGGGVKATRKACVRSDRDYSNGQLRPKNLRALISFTFFL